MNAWFNPISYQIVRQDIYDYVDDHFYVDHPQWTPKTRFPTYCDGSVPISDGRSGVPRVVSRRLLSKPFTVTEYNYSVPGKYRGMGGLLMGSFAALQNWSGVWRFCFGRGIGRLERPNSYGMTFHESWVDPMMRTSEDVFSALFLRRFLRGGTRYNDGKPAVGIVGLVCANRDGCFRKPTLERPVSCHEHRGI